jgi:hypothetical protein
MKRKIPVKVSTKLQNTRQNFLGSNALGSGEEWLEKKRAAIEMKAGQQEMCRGSQVSSRDKSGKPLHALG